MAFGRGRKGSGDGGAATDSGAEAGAGAVGQQGSVEAQADGAGRSGGNPLARVWGSSRTEVTTRVWPTQGLKAMQLWPVGGPRSNVGVGASVDARSGKVKFRGRWRWHGVGSVAVAPEPVVGFKHTFRLTGRAPRKGKASKGKDADKDAPAEASGGSARAAAPATGRAPAPVGATASGSWFLDTRVEVPWRHRGLNLGSAEVVDGRAASRLPNPRIYLHFFYGGGGLKVNPLGLSFDASHLQVRMRDLTNARDGNAENAKDRVTVDASVNAELRFPNHVSLGPDRKVPYAAWEAVAGGGVGQPQSPAEPTASSPTSPASPSSSSPVKWWGNSLGQLRPKLHLHRLSLKTTIDWSPSHVPATEAKAKPRKDDASPAPAPASPPAPAPEPEQQPEPKPVAAATSEPTLEATHPDSDCESSESRSVDPINTKP